MENKQCFLDLKRTCGSDCMAYNNTRECSILSTVDALRLLLKPKEVTKHPPSAPPPKVNL